ncbi:MAG TPA: MFS transporter [Metalysinibacillus jejuensis]|uniref:MFS transporter n=1 Tax=Metalysinibacillus jejuensis TaxID=914327 RepID=A0A921T4L7_9BACL|nr:MFS transporter [Metalysinibacillus jejuensis]
MKREPLSLGMIQMYGLAMFYFTANAVLTVIFPLQASAVGMPEAEIGIMMGMYMFVCMILRPWAGQMVGKHSVFTIMKWLLVGHAIALLLYVIVGVSSLYLVRILQGVVTAFFSMAMQIGVADVLRDEDRGQGMAMYSLSTVLPGLYGPALALLLWSQQSHTTLMLLIVSLAFLPLLFFIKSPLPKTKNDNTSFTLREMFKAFGTARKNKGLVTSSIIMLLGASVFGALSAFLPLFLITTKTGNAAFYLFLQAIVVVTSRFLFRKYIPSDGNWHPKFMAIVLVSSIMGTTLLAVLPHINYLLYSSAIFNGIATAMLYPTLTTYISFVVPDAQRHILLGIFLASYDLGFSLGGFMMGFVIQYVSYQAMFITCSIVGVVALIYNFASTLPPREDEGAPVSS